MFSYSFRSGKRSARKNPRKVSFRRLSLEALEDRLMLATLTVTSLADPAILTAGTLRYEINQASLDARNAISDTIVFDSSLSGGTITLAQGELELSGAGGGAITIDGSSLATPPSVSGNNASSVFQVDGGVQAVFTGFNIEQGNAQLFGGGISNLGTLTVSNVTLSGNTAAYGGAVANFNGGTATLNGDSFSANSSGAYGGAVFNSNIVNATNCIFTSNSSGGSGGAISDFGSGSTCTLTGSTFTGNSALSGGAINNAGTVTVSGSSFSGDTATQAGSGINDTSGTVIIEGQGWTNSETIAATDGSTLDLFGNWTNTGTITVDATSTVALGSTVAIDPTSSAAAGYVWTNNGTITIANGATVYLGGILTTDEYESNLQSKGLSVDLAQDTVYLSGTMDNSAADNPVSAGVLALDAATGPLTVSGGEIFQGAIEVKGTKLTMEAVVNDDNITATGGATLDLYGNWTNNSTITVDASSTLGLGSTIAIGPTSSGAASYVWTNKGTITIANGATVYLGGIFTTDEYESNLQSKGVSVDLAQDAVYLSGTMDNSAADNPVSAGVLALDVSTGPLTLSGGEIYQGTITTSGSDDLVATSSGGTLDGVTLDGSFDNAGTIDLGDSTLNVDGDYTQASTGVLDIGVASSSQYGQLLVSGTAALGGALNVSLLNGFLPQAGDAYEVVTYSQLTGAFDTITGLGPFSNAGYLTPVYNSTNLTLQASAHVSVYWTGDAGDNDWDDPANWSYVDPLVNNVPESVLPGAGNVVVVDLSYQTITIQSGDSESAASLETTAGDTLSITGGSLTAGDVTSSGDLTLGAGGTLTVAGNFTLTSGGTLDEQIGGDPASGLFGQADIGGSAALAGNFNLDLVNGYTPAAGQDYPVLTYASASGSFAAITGLPLGMIASQSATELDLDMTAATIVTWINPNGGNWDVGANWSSGTVPASSDDVLIDTASPATITIQSGDSESVGALETTAGDTLSITGGSLTVGAGTSTLDGPLSMTGGSLTASGAGTTLIATGTTTISSASLYAESGGSLELPTATSYTNANSSDDTFFEASGSGSTLALVGLTTVGVLQSYWNLQATQGGSLDLPALTTIFTSGGTAEMVQISADGSGSTIDLSSLSSLATTGDSTLAATNQATIQDGSLTFLFGINVTLDGTDPQIGNSWTSFTIGSLAVTGGSLDFPNLTDFAYSNLQLSGGAALTFPVLTQGNITLTNATSVTIQGALVSMPADGTTGAAININVPSSQGLTFTLENSGTLADTTVNVGQGSTVALAGGTYLGTTTFNVAQGAVVNLTDGLFPVTGGATYGGTLTGSGAGTVLLPDGDLTSALGGLTLNFPGSLFQWTASSFTGFFTGLGDITNLGTLNLGGPNEKLVYGDGELDNFGTIIETGTGNFGLLSDGVSPTTLVNEAGASYLLESDAGLDNFIGGGPVAVDNAGTIRKTAGSGTSELYINGALEQHRHHRSRLRHAVAGCQFHQPGFRQHPHRRHLERA